MLLEDIGFYTLTEERVRTASHRTPLSRCELILTSKCNFRCPYCRSIGGEDMDFTQASDIVHMWAKHGLKAIRFSGGEPTLWPGLRDLCFEAKTVGINRIAISTNGSADTKVYDFLLQHCGVNDFSVSLDACCAGDGDRMAGGITGAWYRVAKNIEWLASRTYVTVGIVLTEHNIDGAAETIRFAASLGVSDIRVIPAVQFSNRLRNIDIGMGLLEKYPILRYRINNIKEGLPVRGLMANDSAKCGLVLDDMAVNHGKHYPCIIYMREGGKAIGLVGANMRDQRFKWYKRHKTHEDPICRNQCLDVCREYSNKYEAYRGTPE